MNIKIKIKKENDFNRDDNIINKSKIINKYNLVGFVSVLVTILLSGVAFAIPDSINLQGKLTDSSGTPQAGTFAFNFTIYDNFTAGNVLYKAGNMNVVTDANGIYDVILQNLSILNFSDQYYLGIKVGSDAESTPRINLTSSPYSFRANISEDLNRENAYEVSVFNITGNLSLGTSSDDALTVITGKLNISDGNIVAAGNLSIAEKISFSLGAIIDNLVNGILRISSGLNVTGNVTIAQDTLFVDNTSGRVGIGDTTPSDALEVIGNVIVSGSLNASSINVTGNIQTGTLNVTSTTENATFEGDVNIKGILYGGSPLKVGGGINVSGVPAGADAFFVTDNSGAKIFRITDKGALNISPSAGNTSFGGSTLFIDSTNNRTGIGTISPSDTLTVIGSVRVTGSLNATFINASSIKVGTVDVQVVDAVFNKLNYSNEYAASGYDRENVSEYLGGAEVNGSFLRDINISKDLNKVFNLFTRENVSDYLGGSDVNASILKFENISNILEDSYKLGNLTTDLTDGSVSTITITNIVTDSLLVNKNLIVVGNISNANVTNLNINGSLLPALDNFFDIGNGSLRWRNANLTGTLQAGTLSDGSGVTITGGVINAPTIQINSENVQVEAAAFKRGNVSEYLGGAEVNGSFLRDINISPDLAKVFNLFTRENVSEYLGGAEVNASFVKFANLSLILSENTFKLENVSNNTFTTATNDTIALWNVSGSDVFLRDQSGKVGIGKSSPNFALDVEGTINASGLLLTNGSFAISQGGKIGIGIAAPTQELEVEGGVNISGGLNVTDGDVLLATSGGLVGIGISDPNDALEVIGDVRISGSLNATFINASNIKVGTDDVQTVNAVFNKGNYSTEYAASGYDRENVSEYLGGAEVNGSFLRDINISKDLNKVFNLFTRENVSDYLGGSDVNASLIKFGNLSLILGENLFGRGNVSEYLGGSDVNASLIKFGNLSLILTENTFKLENVSNNTIPRGANVSVALWNRTSLTDSISTVLLYPREMNSSVVIGILNTSNNVSDVLTVVGSTTIFGSLNATEINASAIRVNAIDVQVVDAIFNKGNYSTEYAASGYDRENVSEYLGGAEVNGSFLRDINISKDLNKVFNLFTRENVSDYLGGSDVNASLIKFGNLSLVLGENLFGRGNVSEYLGGIDINATLIKVSNLTNVFEAAFNKLNYSNEYAASGFDRENVSEYLGGAEVNGSFLRDINISKDLNKVFNLFTRENVSEYLGGADVNASLIKFGNLSLILSENTFKLENVSNNTFKTATNDTIALWNVSGANIFLRNQEGKVGIGTSNPASALEVAGTANITQGSTSFRVTSDNNIVIHLE